MAPKKMSRHPRAQRSPSPMRAAKPSKSPAAMPGEGTTIGKSRSSGAAAAPKGAFGGTFTLDFSAFPLWLREGPWSPLAVGYILVFAGSLVFFAMSSPLFEEGFPLAGPPLKVCGVELNPRLTSCFVCVYMSGVLLWMVHTVGYFPFMSYTMVSWTLLTFRFFLRAIGGPLAVQEALRFPCIAGHCTTFLVWWVALVPTISYFCETKEKRKQFLAWTINPFLFNVHVLNLPLCILDHALVPRDLVGVDLWIGLCVALGYVLFYLLVLDANGIHFYIIFSPRTKLCVLSYSSVLLLYFAIWRHWAIFFGDSGGLKG